MLHFIDKIMNDAVLGFLALLSLFLMVAPSLFQLSPARESWLFAIGYVIVILFLIEYIVACVCAVNKSQFIFNRWRILDALIIITALVALLPVVPDILRNSPVLRLFRLGRLALLGTRSGLALSSGNQTSDDQTTAVSRELSVIGIAFIRHRFTSRSAAKRLVISDESGHALTCITNSTGLDSGYSWRPARHEPARHAMVSNFGSGLI